MPELTIGTFDNARLARLGGNVRQQYEAQLDVIAANALASGANVKPEYFTQASTAWWDFGQIFAPDDYHELQQATNAYKTGTGLQRALCISSDRSADAGKVQANDLIVITHLGVELKSTSLTLAILDKIKSDLLLAIMAPNNTQRRQIVIEDRFIDWCVPDQNQIGELYPALAGGVQAASGRDVWNLPKYGTWEQGLRLLPWPMVVPANQAGLLQVIVKTGATASGDSGLQMRPRFRYHRLRGVTGN